MKWEKTNTTSEKTSNRFFPRLQNLDVLLTNIKVLQRRKKPQRGFFRGLVSFFPLQRGPMKWEKTNTTLEKTSNRFFPMLQNLDVLLRNIKVFAVLEKTSMRFFPR